MQYSLDELFAKIEPLRTIMLSGEDSEGKWEQRRYDFELFLNKEGTWTCTIQDWSVIRQHREDGVAVSVADTPVLAVQHVLERMGLLT